MEGGWFEDVTEGQQAIVNDRYGYLHSPESSQSVLDTHEKEVQCPHHVLEIKRPAAHHGVALPGPGY